MASKPIKASANSLSMLLGEYNSDSEHDEEPTPEKRSKTVNQTQVAVDAFVYELNNSSGIMSLPVGHTSWTKCMDENTGHPYYWNTDTKDVTWEVPADYQAYLDQNATILRDPRIANMWTMCLSEDSPANVYYVNELTRIVSWNKPIGFVEPKTAVVQVQVAASVEPKPKRNIIKRRKPTKTTKPANPFSDTKDLDSEKIELITSFAAKSDSSSDEEKHREGSPAGAALLKLVATDYNSDDDNSLAGDSSFGPTAIINPRPSHKKCIKNLPSLELPTSTETTTTTKRTKTSFASIIMGGRSPEHVIEPTSNEQPSPSDVIPANEDVVVPVKMQKRKRRIEFITKAPDTSIVEEDLAEQQTLTCEGPPQIVDALESKTIIETSDSKPSAGVYSNFQKSTDELDSTKVLMEEESTVASIEPSDMVHEADGNSVENNAEVTELKETIGAKLKFLCDGRPEVPAVQAITIQLETLLEAFDEGALQAGYMLKWLAGIASDLQTLEADAAPAGWQCLWNRSNGKYCYKHLETGSVRWEYPGNEANGSVHDGESSSGDSQCNGQNAIDDEMDICTTPPPNANEQLMLGNGGSSKSKKKSMATSKSLQPTDTPANNISLELASFYSDIAAIDSAITTAEIIPAENIVDKPDSNACVTNEELVAKKKKRKIKKLTPWRSGNLETWINKWQKAQQEMDN